MRTHDREIMLYYNPDNDSDRKVVAHAHGMTRHLKTFAFGQTPSTTTSWKTILKALDVHPKDLMNKAHPYYQANIRGREFNTEGWLNVLRRNPEILKAPIAVRGNKAIMCHNATDIYRLV